jgi:hypothetical protein
MMESQKVNEEDEEGSSRRKEELFNFPFVRSESIEMA